MECKMRNKKKKVSTYNGDVYIEEDWEETDEKILTFEQYLTDELRQRLKKRYLFTSKETLSFADKNEDVEYSNEDVKLTTEIFSKLNEVQTPSDNIIRLIAD